MIEPPQIVDKPWGREIIFANCEHYIGKAIEIDAGCRLSLQYHRHKDETLFLDSGQVSADLSETGRSKRETVTLNPGDCLRLRPGTVHRFTALDGPARLLEVSTPHPDDVVRLADDFGRS